MTFPSIFVIIPAAFASVYPSLQALNFMRLFHAGKRNLIGGNFLTH